MAFYTLPNRHGIQWMPQRRTDTSCIFEGSISCFAATAADVPPENKPSPLGDHPQIFGG
jgi:hypothetical protein